MFQRTVRRVVPAIAVAVALVLTAPVPAQAAGRELAGPQALFERAWQWMTSFWGGGETADAAEKAGWTIDPDGRTSPAIQDPSCTQVEAGICIDPNG